jgi:sulfur-oxidizing protein SoxX
MLAWPLISVAAGPVEVTASSLKAAPEAVWTGDGEIELPLTRQPGDAQRGQAVVDSRQTGLCLLCHSVNAAGSPQQGNLAPPLAGSGTRLTAAQLRARLVDSRRLNPQSIMPAYFVTLPADCGQPAESPDASADGPRFRRIAASWRGRSLLDAQQIEDVIAYLLTLKEPP